MSMTLSDLHKLMEAEAKDKQIPLSGDFEITPRCNLNCVMCYVRKHPADKLAIEEEMTAGKIISIARQARDMGMLHILLTGGEILIRRDFKYIYEEISKLGLIITLYTNGTLITQDWVDWIATMPPKKVSITMYGASAGTYEKVTGDRDGYRRVVKTIDMLIERKIKVELKTTWVKSCVEEYYQMLEFAQSKCLKLSVVNYIFPSRKNECSNPLAHRLDPDELGRKEFEIENYDPSNTVKLERDQITYDSDELDKKDINNQNGAFRCNAGITSFWLSWRGEILPCGLMNEPKVRVDKSDFKQGWEQLKQLRGKVPVCEDCNKCDARDYCLSCPARLYAENVSFSEPADYLCRHARTRKLLALK